MRNFKEIRPAYCNYCKYRVCPLLQASSRAGLHGGEATTADGIVVWCWCCCGLWLHAGLHNVCASSGKSGIRSIRRGTQQATPAVTFYPLTETAQAPKNKRNNEKIHRPTTIVCWAALSGVDFAPPSQLHNKRSRSVSRAPQLSAAHVTRLYGGAISSLAPPITVAYPLSIP